MDFGMLFDVLVFVLLAYGIIKKILGWSSFKKYEKEGAVIFHYQSKKLLVFQFISLALSFLVAVLYINGLIQGKEDFSFTSISLFLFFFYFGILPTSSGYWALTKKGIYLYLYDRFIKWSEIISLGYIQKKKDKPESPYFMNIIIKKEKGETFKQTNYRCLIPAKDQPTVDSFINEERKKIDRIKLRRKSVPYREELKKNKKR